MLLCVRDLLAIAKFVVSLCSTLISRAEALHSLNVLCIYEGIFFY